jgi:chaperonin GroEL
LLHRAIEDLGIKLENVTLHMRGRTKRCRIEKEHTTIIVGVETKGSIQAPNLFSATSK